MKKKFILKNEDLKILYLNFPLLPLIEFLSVHDGDPLLFLSQELGVPKMVKV